MEPNSTAWMKFVRRIESSGADSFASIIANPTEQEDSFLRRYFGEAKYQRMCRLARDRGTGPQVSRGLFGLFERPRPVPKQRMGGVVVIPGLMGSALTLTSPSADPVWLSYWRIALGRLESLRLASDGESGFLAGSAVQPDGALKQYYGELELALARGWDVRTLAYDWRKDVTIAADALADLIRREFRGSGPVHLVAHSMGGLVARLFMRRHEDLWNRIRGTEGEATGANGASATNHFGRLVMLGTPNYGSHLAVQSLTGLSATVRSLGKLDQRHSINQICEIIASFPGVLQLLPSPILDPKSEPLYQPQTYSRLGLTIPGGNIDKARGLHETLKEIRSVDRMVYVAGSGQATFSGIRNFNRLETVESYDTTTLGDGSVTHALGLLKGVITYYVNEEHSTLTSNERVLNALDALLLTGKTPDLSGGAAVVRSATDRPRSATRSLQISASLALKAQQDQVAERVEELVQTLHVDHAAIASPYLASSPRSEVALMNGDPLDDDFRRYDQIRELQDLLIRGVSDQESKTDIVRERPLIPVKPATARTVAVTKATTDIDLALEYGGIETRFLLKGKDAPDAIGVGHYLNVRPSGSERAVDRAISPEFGKPDDGILTQLAQRGVIRGELGQPFFLETKDTHGKMLAIAGMGPPGRCGVPELTVVVRELCWTLGRMGRQHLATVLIGAGKGNLGIDEAIGAWLRGIELAISGVGKSERLNRVTFIEKDPTVIMEMRRVLRAQGLKADPSSGDRSLPWAIRFNINAELDDPTLSKMNADYVTATQEKWNLLAQSNVDLYRSYEESSVRLSVMKAGNTVQSDSGKTSFLFSALTQSASIPERVVRIDPLLIESGNDRLVAVTDKNLQFDRGRYLEELIFPDDLRRHLQTPSPLVMQLDSSTARIHWEMLAQPVLLGTPFDRDSAIDDQRKDTVLGLSRGLTRQLRTTFVAPPDPAPSPSRTLRVLIVANPASDASLEGAEAEGELLVELFEKYARPVWEERGNRIEVTHLIGPREATRTNVLTEVLLRPYDVLHFAGHCVYDEKSMDRSGWLFSRNELLSANEISRIDRVPGLVFSNACESGITGDGLGQPSPGLCPSFAEAFFAQGVSDFVCTAWKIDDWAAQCFAITFYSQLLGLKWNPDSLDTNGKIQVVSPGTMHEAMKVARLALYDDERGSGTWGAYQHYGNPFHRLFANSARNLEPS